MTDRMGKLSRVLALVHLLADSAEGLTLDEMAAEPGVTRRTAERMRDVIAVNFDLEEEQDDRHKRFRITGSLRRVYTRPTAAEVAALQAEADARRLERAPRAAVLEGLLHKLKGALDDREKRRLDPDLDALARLQRTRVPAGPAVTADLARWRRSSRRSSPANAWSSTIRQTARRRPRGGGSQSTGWSTGPSAT